MLTLIPVQKGGCATSLLQRGRAVGPEDGTTTSSSSCADHAPLYRQNSVAAAMPSPARPRPASFSPTCPLSAVSGRIDSGDLDYTLAQYAFRMLYSLWT